MQGSVKKWQKYIFLIYKYCNQKSSMKYIFEIENIGFNIHIPKYTSKCISEAR